MNSSLLSRALGKLLNNKYKMYEKKVVELTPVKMLEKLDGCEIILAPVGTEDAIRKALEEKNYE